MFKKRVQFQTLTQLPRLCFLSILESGLNRRGTSSNGCVPGKVPRGAEDKATERIIFTTRTHYCANFPTSLFISLYFTHICTVLSLASSVIYQESRQEFSRGFVWGNFKEAYHIHQLETHLLLLQAVTTASHLTTEQLVIGLDLD